jgi:hypothetical protein
LFIMLSVGRLDGLSSECVRGKVVDRLERASRYCKLCSAKNKRCDVCFVFVTGDEPSEFKRLSNLEDWL